MPFLNDVGLSHLIAKVKANKMSEADIFLGSHPVNSLYISDDPTSPAQLYGGTWEKIEGYFLRAGSDTATGGSDTVSLGVANMPSHSHTMDHVHGMGHTHVQSEHSHGLGSSSTCFVTAPSEAVNRGFVIVKGLPVQSGSSWGTVAQNSEKTSNALKIIARSTYSTSVVSTQGASVDNTAWASNGTTSAAGSGTPFSVMPAYRNAHIWKRVA